jgi:NADH-ubiquinone oxidoreductase chain 2
MGLEINLLSFIPLLTKKSMFASEAALKYFLTQALASGVFLLGVLTSGWWTSLCTSDLPSPEGVNHLVSSALLLKMGAAPFHFWFPGVIEGIDWVGNLILMTWQKLAPIVILSYLISPTTLFMGVAGVSVLLGSLGGLNQASLRKIMAYSSINHLGWMVGALCFRSSVWIVYYLVYVLLSSTMVLVFMHWKVGHVSQLYSFQGQPVVTLVLFMNLLSMGGLPPFLGFIPKWFVIQLLTESGAISLVLVMVVFTLVALYFYLRIAFPAFMLTHRSPKWGPAGVLGAPSHVIVLTGLSLGGIVISPAMTLVG